MVKGQVRSLDGSVHGGETEEVKFDGNMAVIVISDDMCTAEAWSPEDSGAPVRWGRRGEGGAEAKSSCELVCPARLGGGVFGLLEGYDLDLVS